MLMQRKAKSRDSDEEPVQEERTVKIVVELAEMAEPKGEKLDLDVNHILKEEVVVQLEQGRLSLRGFPFKDRPDRKRFLIIFLI